jgi:hypothetical protein
MSANTQRKMTNLEYITQQLEYAEEQLALADSMSDRLTWGNRCDALEAAYMDEASKHVSQDARDSVPQVLTVNYI